MHSWAKVTIAVSQNIQCAAIEVQTTGVAAKILCVAMQVGRARLAPMHPRPAVLYYHRETAMRISAYGRVAIAKRHQRHLLLILLLLRHRHHPSRRRRRRRRLHHPPRRSHRGNAQQVASRRGVWKALLRERLVCSRITVWE